ncbi:MAG TPA: DUF488 domain-containing protein [Solirubrobacteraceae bacterium]|nr:DUF488 domain-containing protein [Solirubrobacteraceae bacterium]
MIWQDGDVATATARSDTRSVAELTTVLFGEALSMDQVLARLQDVEVPVSETPKATTGLWVGSIGYELHKDHPAFARHVRAAGVKRLIDVRELPISRRRGYAKSALAEALTDAGVEYIHIRALGNPKPFRDLYKSGRVKEGQRRYEEHLLGDQRGALEDLVPLLREKRAALMCVEHDPATCHRTVIIQALRRELNLTLDVAEIG